MHALKCDFCGGDLVMDNSREFATCEYCGTKYMKETIKEKIQEIKGQVSIVGAVETFSGDTEKERLKASAENLFDLGKFDEAQKIYEKLARQFPTDYKSWLGLYKISIENLFRGYTNKYDNGFYTHYIPNAHEIPKSFSSTLNTALQLSESVNDEIHSYIDEIIIRYGNDLKTINYDYYSQTQDTIEVISASGNKMNANTIDVFTKWLLFSKEEIDTILSYKPLSDLKQKLIPMYLQSCYSGELVPFYYKSDNNEFAQVLSPITMKKLNVKEYPPKKVHTYLRSQKFPEIIQKPGRVRVSYLNIGNDYFCFMNFIKTEMYGKWLYLAAKNNTGKAERIIYIPN